MSQLPSLESVTPLRAVLRRRYSIELFAPGEKPEVPFAYGYGWTEQYPPAVHYGYATIEGLIDGVIDWLAAGANKTPEQVTLSDDDRSLLHGAYFYEDWKSQLPDGTIEPFHGGHITYVLLAKLLNFPRREGTREQPISSAAVAQIIQSHREQRPILYMIAREGEEAAFPFSNPYLWPIEDRVLAVLAHLAPHPVLDDMLLEGIGGDLEDEDDELELKRVVGDLSYQGLVSGFTNDAGIQLTDAGLQRANNSNLLPSYVDAWLRSVVQSAVEALFDDWQPSYAEMLLPHLETLGETVLADRVERRLKRKSHI